MLARTAHLRSELAAASARPTIRHVLPMLKKVSIPGASLSVYDQGQGDPLLFVHGFPLDHRQWHSQLTALAVSHRVIAPDLIGYGGSHAPVESLPSVLSMERFADDCAALLDALAVRQPVIFCGLSMGGYIAWQFVRKHHARLRGLILCNTRSAADAPEAAEGRRKLAAMVREQGMEPIVQAMQLKLLWSGSGHRHPDIASQVRAMMHAAQPEAAAATLFGLAERPDATSLLGNIDLPTLVVAGVHDVISTPHEMHEIARSIPAAHFELIEEAGHLSPLENPLPVNAAIVKFLAGLPPAH